MAETVRLRSRRGVRDPYRFPVGDDALGRALFSTVLASAARGPMAPAMVTLWEREVAWFDLSAVLSQPPPLRERMVAALACQPDAREAALVGVLNLRFGRQGPPTPCAVVYLEWPDNRWWTAWQPVDAQYGPMTEAPTIRRAVDGCPRPGGVGGWFSLCRRLGLRLTLRPIERREGWVH